MPATAFVTPRRWLSAEKSRLDATCFATGGVETRERLRGLGIRLQPLEEVADVFAVSLRQRQFVRNPQHGVWFLSASDLALADRPRDFFLSRARTPRLDAYVVEDGWTLISATGTVGNVTYVAGELVGAAVSQDLIRVRPRAGMLPGYL